jgi:hypothetical protein
VFQLWLHFAYKVLFLNANICEDSEDIPDIGIDEAPDEGINEALDEALEEAPDEGFHEYFIEISCYKH